MKPSQPRRPPPRAPRKDQAPSGSVERRILDSACQLFYQEGLHAVGIDRLLAAAGAAKGPSIPTTRRRTSSWPPTSRRALGNGERVGRTDGWAGLHALFGLVEEFRGCPFLNAVSELPDPAHPGREVARRQREWLHELIRGLVASTGVRDVARVSRAIVVLYDGAAGSAMLDGDPGAVAAARFAASRLLDEQSR